MSQISAVRMARVVAEVTGDKVRADGDSLLVDPVSVSIAARAHLANNGWIPTGSVEEFRVYTHVTA